MCVELSDINGNHNFQLMEELENLEETLNQSIQESVGARAKKGSFRKGDEEENNLRFTNVLYVFFPFG